MAQPQGSQQRKHSQPIHDFLEWMRNNILYAVSPVTSSGTEAARCSFVPVGEAKKYLAANHHTALDDILDELFRPLEPPVDSETILSNYVAVFCILLDIKEGIAIADFVNNDHNDQQLPFDVDHEPPGLPPDTNEGFFEKFCNKQWRFCVPAFQRNMARHFKEKLILPIGTKDKLAGGDNSMIHKIKLYGDYNKLRAGLSTADPNDPLANTFALKTDLSSDAGKYYECEVRDFRGLNRPPNPHLIGFYGNYKYGDSYNVILEYADGGSLEQYFERTGPPCDEEDIIKFWTSLFGIFKALSSIHRTPRHTTADVKVLNGWHQDVKPANILVVSNGASSPYEYQFKLADLGLSHFKMTVEGVDPGTADDAFGTQTYGAPECFRDDKFWDEGSLEVKQNVDIWSFGCVLSEAAVWISKGYSGILKYREDRGMSTESINKRLGDCFHDGQGVLPLVQGWHESIQSALRHCDNVTPGVLRIIKEDMLQDSDFRANPKQIWRKAKALVDTSATATPANNVMTQRRTHTQVGAWGYSRDSQDSARDQWSSLPLQQSPSSSPLGASRTEPSPIRAPNYSNGRPLDFGDLSLRHHNSTRNRSNLSGPYQVAGADSFSAYDRSSHSGNSAVGLGVSRIVSAGRSRRPMSQPESTIDRPNPRPFSSDNHIMGETPERISEEDPFYDDQRDWPMPEDVKGKGPLRRIREMPAPRHTDPTSSTTQGVRPKNENRMQATGYEQDSPSDRRGHSRGYSTSSTANSAPSHQSRWNSQMDAHLTTDNASSSMSAQQPPSVASTQPLPVATTGLNLLDPGTSTQSKVYVPPKKRSNPKDIPYLPLAVAIEWRSARKDNARLKNIFRQRPVPKLPYEFLLGKVGRRDHVLIIDDSGSMRDHWPEMWPLFSILAYLVKKSDEDGIDMYFTMTAEGYKNHRNVSELVQIVQRRKDQLEGISNINGRLDQVLMEYDRDLQNQNNLRKLRSPSAPAKDKKPLSVYVFTDGVWTKRSDPRPAITKIVSSLDNLGYPAPQAGIQFISFGRDPEALKNLNFMTLDLV